MANIPLTLRLIKGSKLTFAELDANFTSLANSINNLPQNDSFVTGGTFNQSTYSIDFTGNYDFIPFSTDLSYLASDITVTGGTYNPSNGTVTFYNNSGGTFQVSGFLTGYTNYYTTGVTLNNTTLEFDRTDLSNAYSIDLYPSLSAFSTTDYYTTGVTLNGTTLEFDRNDLSNAYSVDLSSLQFTGNTSGDCITDLYISNLYGCSPIKVWDNLTLSGSVIDSQGGGYLDLRYGNSDGRFYLGNDNGGYSDTFIQGENGYLEISAYDPAARIAMFTDGGNAGFVLTNDTSFFSTDINLYTDTTSIVSTPNNYIGLGSGNSLEITNDNVWVKGNETFNITTNPHSGVGLGTSSDLLIATVTGTSYTTNTLRETNPSILSSQYSTIQMGIKNSVILGGYNLNATQDNTAYVDNLNINTIGSGTSVINLGLDSSGNVVTGTTGGGSFTGNTSGDCITDLYVSNLYGCSPITIHDNLVIESGITITSTNGGGQIELDYFLQPSNILISTDNGGGTEAFINLQPTELNLSSLNGDVRIQSLNSNNFRSGNLFSNRSQILMEPDFVKIGVVDPSAVFSNDYESVVVYNTLSSDQTTSNGNKWPVIVSSKNSTILSGIRNSVILGGSDITASTNNTVYVDNLNINTIGSGTSVINLGLDSNGYVVTGTTSIGSFTGNTSGDCINDIYVSNIHSCSPLNINPNDEGNVYFGSTSGITIDLSNTRLGIGTPSPQYPIQILGSNSTFYYDPSSVGGRFNISGSTGIPRFDVSVAGSGTRIATGGSIGMRNWGDSTWTGYGRVGDMFMYAGNETYGLNFVNPAGTNQLTRPTEDYIRFYAGQDASTGNTPDIHIQGSGSTRGYVGIGTETPTSKLHVNGDSFINGTLSANSISISGVTLNPKQTIALFFGSDSTSPLDSTTYYMGNSINLAAVTTPSDGRRVIMPKTGNIVRVDIVQTVGGTLGSSETSTFTINNITQATSSTITTTLSYDVASSNNAYVLSTPLSVNQDDKVEIRWSTPAWVTNPTSVRHQMNVYLEY
jgi:hypothetical protein